jgi:MULE transposase domain
MEQEHIEEPVCFVTDREIALIGALDNIFPNSIHLLCTWHVNMNILANCRKHFPKDKAKPKTNEVRNRAQNQNRPANRNWVANRNDEVIPDPQWEKLSLRIRPPCWIQQPRQSILLVSSNSRSIQMKLLVTLKILG